jgi:hypothetical protein
MRTDREQAGILMGAGGFNFYDGVIQHAILHFHLVNEHVCERKELVKGEGELSNNTAGKQKSFPGRLGTLLCVWFLGGMFLSMLLSGLYSVVGLPLPPMYFFLSSVIYLTGGLLGGMWSRERFPLRKISCTEVIVTLFVLLLSICFLLLGIFFIVIGFRHL